jgi:hypothetical protein
MMSAHSWGLSGNEFQAAAEEGIFMQRKRPDPPMTACPAWGPAFDGLLSLEVKCVPVGVTITRFPQEKAEHQERRSHHAG